MKAKLLIVDDEKDLLELLQMNLGREGYLIRTAQTGAEAMRMIVRERPDLVLLDIMLEDASGLELTGRLKNTPETAAIPIILLTAKDAETDVVVGLRMGADDYVTKPFSTQVLVARVEAVLRRNSAASAAGPSSDKIRLGNLTIHPGAREVLVEDGEVDLTGGEYSVLIALVQAGGNVMTRAALRAALGDGAQGQKERIVDVHIASLRKKLGAARKMIKTVHGQGYRINA